MSLQRGPCCVLMQCMPPIASAVMSHFTNTQVTELQSLADRCARDRTTAEREVERIMAAAAGEHATMNEEVERVCERMAAAEAERDEVAGSLRWLQAELSSVRQELARSQQAATDTANDLRKVSASSPTIPLRSVCGDAHCKE